jgi:hypothetical protein
MAQSAWPWSPHDLIHFEEWTGTFNAANFKSFTNYLVTEVNQHGIPSSCDRLDSCRIAKGEDRERFCLARGHNHHDISPESLMLNSADSCIRDAKRQIQIVATAA